MDRIIKPPTVKKEENIEDRAEKVIEKISQREEEFEKIKKINNDKKRKFRKKIAIVFVIFMFCGISIFGILFFSYNNAISFKTGDTKKVNFIVQ